MTDISKSTVVILGTGATIGSGYTHSGRGLPGDRGFFGNDVVRSLLKSGHYPALDYMLESFRQLYDRSLKSVGLEEVWTFLEFAGKELFRGAVSLEQERKGWVEAICKPGAQTLDEHCLCVQCREDQTIPPSKEIDLLLVAGWDLRRLLNRVYDELVQPAACNRYLALLDKYGITKDQTTTLISLNYDTVLESALCHAGIPWHYRHVPTTVLRNPCSIRVLKPHGSLNWRFHGNEPPIEIGTDYRMSPVKCQSRRNNDFEEQMIIPPTQIKQAIMVAETQTPEVRKLFREIWTEAVDALHAASRVFVIGYSFPPTDLHLRTMFHLASRKREFQEFDEVFLCTTTDGEEGRVFANAVRYLKAKSFHLCADGFDKFIAEGR